MRALILVDLQHDFMPWGALPVAEGDRVVPICNALQPVFEHVVATQDWHPPNHGSFAASHPGKKPGDVVNLDGIEQILWPRHCQQNTRGAELVEFLDTRRIERIFHKGVDPRVDSYSTFFDNAHRRDTGLADHLRRLGVAEVYLAGLATDYCVRYSAMDALELGFRTFVVEDACRGVNLRPGDDQRALEEVGRAGAIRIQSSAILDEARELDRPQA